MNLGGFRARPGQVSLMIAAECDELLYTQGVFDVKCLRRVAMLFLVRLLRVLSPLRFHV